MSKISVRNLQELIRQQVKALVREQVEGKPSKKDRRNILDKASLIKMATDNPQNICNLGNLRYGVSETTAGDWFMMPSGEVVEISSVFVDRKGRIHVHFAMDAEMEDIVF